MMALVIEGGLIDALQTLLMHPVSANNPNITWGMLLAFVGALWLIGDVIGEKT